MTAVSCSVCGAPIDPRTEAHYAADPPPAGSGRRWCLEHGVVYAPAPAEGER